MRSWLACCLLSVALLTQACADGAAPQNSSTNPGSAGDTTSGSPNDDNTNGAAPNSPLDAGKRPSSTDPESDAAGETALDAGTDAGGPQCNVPKNASRGFHCTYINRIATGILAPEGSGLPPIQGCKDFPPEVSQAEVTRLCEDIFPALDGSVMVAAGTCALTNAKGYCSDTFGGRDFAYHANCDITDSAGGSGSWACDKVTRLTKA